MPNQETPSKREIADYVDHSDFPDDKAKTALKPELDYAASQHSLMPYGKAGLSAGSDQEDWFNAERELKKHGQRDPRVALPDETIVWFARFTMK